MNDAAANHSVPIGAVLPYAGNLNGSDLGAAGWLICDGKPYEIGDQHNLYDVIGTTYGEDGDGTFCVPDYRGLFLRGLDPTEVDADGEPRAISTIQGYATAQPWENPFLSSPLWSQAGELGGMFGGTNVDMLQAADDSGPYTAFGSDLGGDVETRPVNAYVRFVIRASAINGQLLAGMVVPFPGPKATDELNKHYVMCDGSGFSQTQRPQLWTFLGGAHGSNGGDQYNLPDYRGRFLRGLDPTSLRDTEAVKRTPMAPGGAKEANVGSVQGYATARPVILQFNVQVLIGDIRYTSDSVSARNRTAWNDGALTINLTHAGGDKETRPVNVNVDHYLLTEDEPADADFLPIGAVIAYPMTTPLPDDRWALCNGYGLSRSAPEHQALEAAIGDANGGTNDAFNLPDYRGYFLRGCDHGHGLDPDAARRGAAAPGGAEGDNVGSRQPYATAKPVTADITAFAPNMPITAAEIFPDGDDSLVGDWDRGNPDALREVNGGDPETRPQNASVMFYIRYR